MVDGFWLQAWVWTVQAQFPCPEKHTLKHVHVPATNTNVSCTQVQTNTHNYKRNSFPGGRCEDGETAHETSMREMDEEIGVTPEQVWGSLSRPVVSLKLENVYASVGYIGHFEDLRMKLSVNEVNVVFSWSISRQVATFSRMIIWVSRILTECFLSAN